MSESAPYDPQDELRKLLAGAGLYNQQIQQLQPRMALGQQMMQPQTAQGAHVGNTYVASSPLEHLSNAIRQIVGAKITQGAMDKQAGLTQQLANTRQQYMQQLQTAQMGGQAGPGPGTPYQQFATPLDQQGIGQNMAGRPPDPQAAQGLELAGVASGDPVIGQTAQYLRQASQFQQQHGPQAALGGMSTDAYKAQTERNALTRPEWEVNPMNGGFYNRRSTTPPTGGGGTGSLLTPEAKKQAAVVFHTTGQLPSAGMGQAGAAVRREIMNMAAEMFPDDNRAVNKAGFQADAGSLAKAQSQADSIESFENTALKNLDQFLQTAHGVIDTGSPLLNAPIRSLSNKVMGDTNMTKFNTARQVAIQEISKVLGGAVSGGAVTEGQRHEVEGLIRGDASVAQIEAAANILKTDMANRKASVHAQLDAIRGRMSGKAPAAETAATPNGAPAQAPAAPGAVRMQAPDGSVHLVPAEKVDAAKAAGGKVL